MGQLRPGVFEFLDGLRESYEMHIYTMGDKNYAAEIRRWRLAVGLAVVGGWGLQVAAAGKSFREGWWLLGRRPSSIAQVRIVGVLQVVCVVGWLVRGHVGVTGGGRG